MLFVNCDEGNKEGLSLHESSVTVREPVKKVWKIPPVNFHTCQHREINVTTHPHKKGPVRKNYTRHLTSFSMVIYQAEHDLWYPINVGWENFAQWLIFQVK